MAGSSTFGAGDSLTTWSRTLHGHRYVLPVADWIIRSGSEVISASEAMNGLGGRVDRTRVLEALTKLTEIKALREFPRPAQPNSPRTFERRQCPYWAFAERYIAEVQVEDFQADEELAPSTFEELA